MPHKGRHVLCFAKGSNATVRALAWLGRQGTRALATLVFIGIAVPPLGAVLKPFVTDAIFLLLVVSFMRVDIAALRVHMRRPGVVLAATAWSTLVVPFMVGVVCVGDRVRQALARSVSRPHAADGRLADDGVAGARRR